MNAKEKKETTTNILVKLTSSEVVDFQICAILCRSELVDMCIKVTAQVKYTTP